MSKRSILYVCLALLGAVVLIAAILLGYSVDWTGFKAYSAPQEYHPPKAIWDWLGLLIIPLVLGVGVFFLNQSEERRQALIAEDRVREDRLQAYLTAMKELLLDYHLRTSKPDDEQRQIARTLTITVLSNLDGKRRSAVLLFLRDLELITKSDLNVRDPDKRGPIIRLAWADFGLADLREADLKDCDLTGIYLTAADLSGADLSRAELVNVDLTGANLSAAILDKANLINAVYNEHTVWPQDYDLGRSQAVGPEADLTEADLKGIELADADLHKAILTRAHLEGANLSEADLSGADLREAHLSGTNLIGADLRRAILTGADLSGAKYDYATKWPRDFDPVKAGAKEEKVTRPGTAR